MQLSEPEIKCSICHNPVALETAKTDEVGQAVHEQCYVLILVSRPTQTPSTGQTNTERSPESR
jgi:hypothetical protein